MEHHNQRQRAESIDHVSVDIVTSNETLVSSIREQMETISPPLCIYKVPEDIRNVNKKAYIPEEVSIGPFHHGREGLELMEEHKWRYLHALLSRKPNLEASLDDCVKAIRELEQRARKCYQGSISLGSNEFVEMMIVDGCFLIELFLKYSIHVLKRRGDPIFIKKGMLFSLRCDMILLENQLPFFILQCLFNIVPIPKQCGHSLIELVFRFFKIMIPGDEEFLRNRFQQRGNHLLDIIHNCFALYHSPSIPSSEAHRTIHSVERLQHSGIKFKKAAANSLLEVTFDHGVLKIPPIHIHNYTNSLLRNLIALEHCSIDPMKYVTSYAFLMCSLISSPTDVHLLQQKEIISTGLENNEVSRIFMNICKEVDLKDFYYSELCERINAYNAWWVTLKRKYWQSKRKRFMFIFAAVLVLLTITGTLFSVLSYYVHHRK